MVKQGLRWLLSRLYRVQVNGIENYHAAGDKVLIVANHTSFLDPALLWAFLPEDATFAINTHIARKWWVRPGLRLAKVFPMDPMQPLSVKALTHYLKENRKAAIFPEGRITVTGALMKIYEGAGLIADKSGAAVLPIRIDGAQYTPVSRLHGVVRLRWFPPITLNILPAKKIELPPEVRGHQRRHLAGFMLSDIMSNMVFETGNHRQTLFAALLDARKIHGGHHIVLEDMQRQPVSYNRLIVQTLALGRKLALATPEGGGTVGLMLPNLISTVAAILGLHLHGRVPAMLNFSAGPRNLASALTTANIKTVVTARRFVANAKLETTVEALAEQARVLYLEDLAAGIGVLDQLRALAAALTADYWHPQRARQKADDPAAILFTSGSEGAPKGVALSHQNLLANREQLAARLDLNAQDVILNALPMFHAFGLTAGTLLPLLNGMRIFLYPTPLHYRIIPEVAYEINATLLFGTNTFLAGYAKYAHPYDFYSVRYVFAGAEKLQADTKRLWAEKFGLRILEGYGATETSPILTANTPMFYRDGTVGRFMPGVEWRLEEVPGVEGGGRLHVRGPNIMLGYLRPERPGLLEPPASSLGPGWYDTGDIVHVDAEGFVSILGRVKRFAKIAGEMVSLGVVEELAARLWPGQLHAAVTVPDEKKGERIILVSQCKAAERGALVKEAQRQGYSELYQPKEVRVVKELPLLPTGKVDYPALTAQVRAEGAL
jgi:acyl-[acyl-carrier-protein]-phospholipid O-acyltransferase/long-chain-fatty-acid--[acyl-carrier-protein] ligase